jgi:tungstate transport system ATP-binding protein
MNSRGPILKATDLTVVLGGHEVLDVPSFEVRQDEVLVILGPNGSGKSTLVLALGMLLKSTTGTVIYRGKPVLTGPQQLAARKHFAAVFQESLLLGGSVFDNVALGLRLHGMANNEIKKRAETWLERFGISSLAKRQAKTLSGGEAKRTSLARAFALQPQILFLDEPFTALDTPTRQALLEDFQSILRETRMTTVLVTHDHNEALALADRVVVLIGGRVHQIGTPEEIFSTPADEDVAGFVQNGNILQGTIAESTDGLASLQVCENQLVHAVSDLSPGTRVAAFLPYDDVTLVVGDSPDTLSSARNRLKGTIVKAFPQGSQLKITLDCGFAISAVITHRSWEELGLDIGRQVTASFKASALHLIPRL